MSAHVIVFICKCVCVCGGVYVGAHHEFTHSNTHLAQSCCTPISHHHWWKLPNPRYLIKRSLFFPSFFFSFFFWRQIHNCLWCLITFFGKLWSKEQTVWQILIFGIDMFPPNPPLSVGLIFHPPHHLKKKLFLSRLRWWILCCSSSNVRGEAPEIGEKEGGKGGGCRSGRELSGRNAM